jgi:hypothetical protein
MAALNNNKKNTSRNSQPVTYLLQKKTKNSPSSAPICRLPLLGRFHLFRSVACNANILHLCESDPSPRVLFSLLFSRAKISAEKERESYRPAAAPVVLLSCIE